MTQFDSHPTDRASKVNAQNLRYTGLVIKYEDVVLSTLPHRYEELQSLACETIARIGQLERQLAAEHRMVSDSLYGCGGRREH